MAKKKDNGVPAERVLAEDFVRAWQDCDTSKEAKEKLGQYAVSRAKRLRDAGVKLKTFPREGGRLDVQALNSIIAEEG